MTAHAVAPVQHFTESVLLPTLFYMPMGALVFYMKISENEEKGA